MHAIADAIVKRADEIAYVECVDTGQAIRYHEQGGAARRGEFPLLRRPRARCARTGCRCPTEDHINYTIRQPIGPVGVITPWNTPFMLSTWKIAPALAAGCTVVHKPAEWSPLTAHAARRDRARGGAARRVCWNLVHGFGESAGKALTEHPDIKAIAFVGESRDRQPRSCSRGRRR